MSNNPLTPPLSPDERTLWMMAWCAHYSSQPVAADLYEVLACSERAADAAILALRSRYDVGAELVSAAAEPDRVATEPLTVERAEVMLRARDDWKAVAGIGAATNCPNFEHSSGKRWVHFAHDKVWSRVDGDFWRRCTAEAGFASFLEGKE